jgi:hypothetical protein
VPTDLKFLKSWDQLNLATEQLKEAVEKAHEDGGVSPHIKGLLLAVTSTQRALLFLLEGLEKAFVDVEFKQLR